MCRKITCYIPARQREWHRNYVSGVAVANAPSTRWLKDTRKRMARLYSLIPSFAAAFSNAISRIFLTSSSVSHETWSARITLYGLFFRKAVSLFSRYMTGLLEKWLITLFGPKHELPSFEACQVIVGSQTIQSLYYCGTTNHSIIQSL